MKFFSSLTICMRSVGVIFADDGHDGLGAILVDGIVENVAKVRRIVRSTFTSHSDSYIPCLSIE